MQEVAESIVNYLYGRFTGGPSAERAFALVRLFQRTFNVFHVAEAVGSPSIPAQQDFVIPAGIRSCLGFGGMLPRGDLFALIMFSRVSIPYKTAAMFKTLSLSVKSAILPFESKVLACVD